MPALMNQMASTESSLMSPLAGCFVYKVMPIHIIDIKCHKSHWKVVVLVQLINTASFNVSSY